MTPLCPDRILLGPFTKHQKCVATKRPDSDHSACKVKSSCLDQANNLLDQKRVLSVHKYSCPKHAVINNDMEDYFDKMEAIYSVTNDSFNYSSEENSKFKSLDPSTVDLVRFTLSTIATSVIILR